MNLIKITHLPMQHVSSVYYKDSFIGIAEDGDSTAMQRLMNQALELHDKKEKEKETAALLKVARAVYRLDQDEVSEAKMLEIVKESFA
jgi:N-acyl-D-aspartate/D-glutamate deacylase